MTDVRPLGPFSNHIKSDSDFRTLGHNVYHIENQVPLSGLFDNPLPPFHVYTGRTWKNEIDPGVT